MGDRDLEIIEELDRIPEHIEESGGREYGTHSIQYDDKPVDEEDRDLETMEENSELGIEEIFKLKRILKLAEESKGHKHDIHSV
jgi:hypothetical protein